MKKWMFLLIVVGVSCGMLSNSSKGDIKNMPANETAIWFSNQLNRLNSKLDVLNLAIEQGESDKQIEMKFLEVREVFKKIEFLIAYLDPQEYNTYINGAPLPKIMPKVPDLTIVEPTGLQRMEELVYEESIDSSALKEQVKTLKTHLTALTPSRIKRELIDAVVFEAIRFGIMRINTMGITGFDSPGNTDKSLEETAISLKGIQIALARYQVNNPNPEALWIEFNRLCKKGDQVLRSTDFESFDRAAFLREIGEPLWRITLDMQRNIRIELPNIRSRMPMALNYESATLFSDDILNVDVYGEYRDPRNQQQRVELGRLLFFDPILSGGNDRACASCHLPEKGFTDGRATAMLVGKESFGERNSPTIINSIYADRYFHDMRVDRLSAQMDHVVFNTGEFDSDYKLILNKLIQSEEYKKLFAEVYGREGITKNSVTNAVTSYVASIRSFNSPFDKFMRGESNDIDPSVIRGFNLFSGKAACATCHFAPTFAGLVPPNYFESESEVLGVPERFEEPYTLDDDMGRWSNRIIKEKADFYKRSFKTPTLRNVELTAPYMHNGTFETLEDVMDFYNEGGGIGLGLDVPHQTLPADSLELEDHEIEDIISFMKSLTDTTRLNQVPARLPKINGHPEWDARVIGGEY